MNVCAHESTAGNLGCGIQLQPVIEELSAS
jgi:hypothetical protein